MEQAGYKVLYMNLERGELTLEGTDITEVPVKNFEKFTYILDRIIEKRKEKIVLFDTIFVDSAKEFIKQLLKSLRSESKAVKSGNQDANVSSLREYMKAVTNVDEVFEKLAELPINFVFVTPEDYDTNEMNERLWMPDLPKGTRNSFYQYCDGVWRLSKDRKGRRWLQTDGSDDVHAKTRVPAVMRSLPRMIPDPDISQIFDYWSRKIDFLPEWETTKTNDEEEED